MHDRLLATLARGWLARHEHFLKHPVIGARRSWRRRHLGPVKHRLSACVQRPEGSGMLPTSRHRGTQTINTPARSLGTPKAPLWVETLVSRGFELYGRACQASEAVP